MQLESNIQLQSDNETVFSAQDVDGNALARVVVTKFQLWVPKLSSKDSMYNKYVSSFLKQKRWKYLRELYTESNPTKSSGFFRISSSIDNLKHIFVYLKNTNAPNNNSRQQDNSYNFKTLVDLGGGSLLSNYRIEYGNGIYYPETEYDTDFKLRIYNDLMSYAMRKNDYDSGTQLNTSNFNLLYGLIYFDLTFQSEKSHKRSKRINFQI